MKPKHASFGRKPRPSSGATEASLEVPDRSRLLAGNVNEWVQDGYASTYDGVPKGGAAHEPAGVAQRVLRGGGWARPIRYCRSAARNRLPPSIRNDSLGFRPARSR